MLKKVACKTSDYGGDKVTAATILVETIDHEGLKNATVGASPMCVKRGISNIVTVAIEELKRTSKKVEGDEIRQVTTVSPNWDNEISQIIAEVVKRVGKEGTITTEEAKAIETSLDVVKGMQHGKGYPSPYFVNNPAVWSLPYRTVLGSLLRIFSILNELLPTLQVVAQSGKPLTIITKDIESGPFATLIVNNLRRTLNVCAVKAPGFGNRRKAMLAYIAISMGDKFSSDDLDIKLESIRLTDLGQAKCITVEKDSTAIVERTGSKSDIHGRVKLICGQFEDATSEYDCEKLQELLRSLPVAW
jgi:chaperonin GroEL